MFSTKIFILLACSLTIAMAAPVDNGEMIDAPIQLTGDEIEGVQEELQVSLNHLAADNGPHYKISKVISASVQVASGATIKMNVDLIDTDGAISNCNVSIWSSPWLVMSMPYISETTIDCDGHKIWVESHLSK